MIPSLYCLFMLAVMLCVVQVMTQLWHMLLPPRQQSVLLGLYTAEVLAYLSSCLASRQWRDREAACTALEAFLSTKTWGQEGVRGALLGLWTGGMRVLDDVRDSTRRASVGFMKVLSNLVMKRNIFCLPSALFYSADHDCLSLCCVALLRCAEQIVSACNPELQHRRSTKADRQSEGYTGELTQQQSVVEDATGFIVPLLLDKGLLEPSPEGRGFSLGLLLRVVKVVLFPWH